MVDTPSRSCKFKRLRLEFKIKSYLSICLNTFIIHSLTYRCDTEMDPAFVNPHFLLKLAAQS